jgi:hypothetical protein
VKADDVYVTGRLERISPPSGWGGGGGLDWSHALAPGQTLILGFSGDGLPGNQWGSGRAGATWSVGRAGLGVNLQGGYSNVEGSFFQAGGSLTHPLVGTRVSGDAECRYVWGRTAKGTLVKAGLTLLPGPSLLLQAGYFQSLGGTLGSQLGVVKAVYTAGPRRFLAGGSIGRTSPSVLGIVDLQLTQTVRHAFAGAVFPVGAGGELTTVIEYYDLGVVNRSLLTLTWKMGHRPAGG